MSGNPPTDAELDSLVRDGRDYLARYEEEFADTFLDGLLGLLKRLIEVIEELRARD